MSAADRERLASRRALLGDEGGGEEGDDGEGEEREGGGVGCRQGAPSGAEAEAWREWREGREGEEGRSLRHTARTWRMFWRLPCRPRTRRL